MLQDKSLKTKPGRKMFLLCENNQPLRHKTGRPCLRLPLRRKPKLWKSRSWLEPSKEFPSGHFLRNHCRNLNNMHNVMGTFITCFFDLFWACNFWIVGGHWVLGCVVKNPPHFLRRQTVSRKLMEFPRRRIRCRLIADKSTAAVDELRKNYKGKDRPSANILA